MSLLRAILCLLLLVRVTASTNGESPHDLLSLGDTALTMGHSNEAVQYYEQGLERIHNDNDNDPTVNLLTELSLYTNLATAYSAMGQDHDAIAAYEKTLVAYKGSSNEIVDTAVKLQADEICAQAAFFLGMVYQDLGKPKDAAEAYQKAHELDPWHWASMANYGAVLNDEQQYQKAVTAYNTAYDILMNPEHKPTDPPAEPRFILSQLQYRIGLCISHDLEQTCVLEDDPEKTVSCQQLATHAFSLAVEYDADNESAKHMLATLTADATVDRASNSYVKSLFDDYAANFEHSLVQELGYTGYERLRRGFDKALGNVSQVPVFAKVVDAGCGTGLVGEQFRNVSQYLIGVDLSQAILSQAVKARPGLYNETVKGDVTQVFRDYKPIDLIIAADSYIYFGDLVPLFESMREGLQNGGYAAFTLENSNAENEKLLAESTPDWRWQLTASGRFAHRQEYVLAVAQAHDFQLVHYEKLNDFRFEKGVGVRGHIFVLQKTESREDQQRICKQLV